MEAWRCEVEKTDEYVIEFDTKECNEAWMEEFRDFFYGFHDLEDHARYLSKQFAERGSVWLEGYGILLVNGKVPGWVSTPRDLERVNHAINVKIIQKDNIYLQIKQENTK